MHSWVVGSAVILTDHGLLLVQNRRRGGHLDWSPPGGVIETDDGEDLIDGLAREVLEETGLRVTGWQGPIYDIEAEAPDLGWTLRVEVYVATSFEGELVIDDPDGIVIDAKYVALDDCGGHLEGNHPWVVEPLTEWLAERWDEPRSFGYRVDGADLRTLVVTRL